MSGTNPYAALYQQKLGEATPPPNSAPEPPEQSMMQKVGGVAKDVGIGALKGAGSTANNLGHLIYPDWLAKHLTGAPSAEQQEGYFHPDNTAQRIGKGIEQGAEFLVPGGAEEAGVSKLASLAPKLGRAAEPLAKIGVSALSSGAVNKAQGGDFGTGAAFGAGGAAVGQGLKAAAPMVAESALGIPKAARAFGKTPGEAIIKETRGIRPETIAASARESMNKITPQLESAAAAAPGPASLTPARTILSDAATKAQSQNAAGLHGQLTGMGDTLSRRFDTGTTIPPDVSPSELLNLKRGFSDEHLRWNPETHDRALSAGRQAYGALDSELDRTVPEAAGLNQRLSSLIPVANRAESVSRNAPTVQRALGRFGAHTGALTLGGVGAAEGYREGHIPGAIAGGLTGVLAPELIASPEGQMAAARLLSKSGSLRPVVGGALQGNRKEEK